MKYTGMCVIKDELDHGILKKEYTDFVVKKVRSSKIIPDPDKNWPKSSESNWNRPNGSRSTTKKQQDNF
jgi:hypothetical protein